MTCKAHTVNSISRRILLTTLALGCLVDAATIHVATTGDDANPGSNAAPFRTIQRAAKAAMPGDTIAVHAGIYREWINPPRGGESEEKRIIYQAYGDGEVQIKGSEVVKTWTKVGQDIWKAELPNSMFGGFNPYSDLIRGNWFNSKGRNHHTGAVYLNGEWLDEAATLDDVLKPTTGDALWFGAVDAEKTTIHARFVGVDPNRELTEINVRRAVFYPDQPGRNFITVRGFTMRQAATPWAPPTAEQVGLIGPHWSKGWIIENNTISHSVCSGISLGKYGDEWDNKGESVDGYVNTIRRALDNGWNPETVGHHIVRNNEISHCEQAGIVGSFGASYSVISDNRIHDIHVRRRFSGPEVGGIKFHGGVDVVIRRNHIYRTLGSAAVWLDWMGQGARIAGNLLNDNSRDLFLEVNHGPILVDNNIFLSPQSMHSCSRGVAFAHNLFGGSIQVVGDGRVIPFLKPHDTEIAGFHAFEPGDDRYHNNIFAGAVDLRKYDGADSGTLMEGNVFLKGATPSSREVAPVLLPDFDAGIKLVTKPDGCELQMNGNPQWRAGTPRKLVTSKMLGRAQVTGGAFEQPDGSAIQLDTDYLGRRRNDANPAPGPLEALGPDSLSCRVWSPDPQPAAPTAVADRFNLLPAGAVRLDGLVDDRIKLMAGVWFEGKTLAEMVDIFRRRPNGFADGEFWGKAVRALCHQVEYQQDPRLRDLLKLTLADLMGTQTKDGCISGYKPDKQPYNTDVWDRKYVLLGLINGYETTRDPQVLDAAVRAADHLLTQLGPPPKVRVMDTAYITGPPRLEGGFQGIESSSILEPMVRLYQLTGKREYLDFARYLVEVEGGSKRGSIFEVAFAGKDVRDFGGDGIPRHSVAHAYSVISCFEGLVEFYRATGNEHWKKAILNMYDNALAKETVIIGAQCGLGPNVGLASTEQFSHSAFHQTCPVQDGLEGCTHARWMGLNRQLLQLTGESRYADQFERTLYNAFLGSIKPDGQMVDYHTHLNGTRPAKMNYRKTFNGKVITCCIYNVVDSLAMIPTVAVMGDGEGAVVNLYIPGTARVKLTGGNEVVLEQATDYPRTGRIDMVVRPAKAARFPIRLRIPEWSATTLASVNGEPQETKPGNYLRLDRTWSAGDRISLTLDMRCHLVKSPPGSPKSADGFRALVRGPVVLARDKRLGGDVQEEVEIQADANGIVPLTPLETTLPALMQFAVPTTTGGSFPVVDFASAGNTWDAASEYVTWIPRPGKPVARWIWFPDPGNPARQAPVGRRWFRRVLELPAGREIKQATATFCADNQLTLFVNGRPVGTCTNWQQPVTLDLQSNLKPGAIVLAVEATNTTYQGPNAAGLLGQVRIDFKEGPPMICFTDGTWKASDQEAPGWQTPGFKDEGWKPARVLGRNGITPWGALKEFND